MELGNYIENYLSLHIHQNLDQHRIELLMSNIQKRKQSQNSYHRHHLNMMILKHGYCYVISLI